MEVLCDLVSLKFNVLIGESSLDEVGLDSVPVVSLEDYLAVLRCAATGTKILEFLREFSEILVFVVYAFDHCCCFSPFACF